MILYPVVGVVDGPTTIELTLRWIAEIEAALDALATHTRVRRIRKRAHVLDLGPQYEWLPLEAAGVVAQAAAHREYSAFVAFGGVIMSDGVLERRRRFNELTESVRALIQHDEAGSWYGIPELAERARASLREQGEMLSALAVPTGRVMVVPDTSSLLDAPNLEAHDYGTSAVELVLVPVVLRQLDAFKHKGAPEVRANARRILADIRSYRTGGSPRVSVAQNVELRAIATEPRFEQTLPWLDRNVEDDQLIASVLEITRDNLGSRVVLVTEDINLENKATLARIPFCSTREALANGPPPSATTQIGSTCGGSANHCSSSDDRS